MIKYFISLFKTMEDDKKNTGVNNTGAENSGDRNSGNGNTGKWNSGDWNSGDENSGKWNSGIRNTGNGNSGNGNTGKWNSGNWNSGKWNTGFFNTNEPNARFFNKKTDIKLSDFYSSDACPSWAEFDLCVWVQEEIMNAEEKKENPTYKTTGGYLKTLEYKEAWSVFWRKTDEENRQKFLNLPNFDAEIFKEITGIDVNKESKTLLVKGKEVSEDTIDKALKAYFK
jgi:hypothetical protein